MSTERKTECPTDPNGGLDMINSMACLLIDQPIDIFGFALYFAIPFGAGIRGRDSPLRSVE
jgi:hypothetical protein